MAKDLKESTRTLCRQLQENPDLDANKRKIQHNKYEVAVFMEELIQESRDLSYTNFKTKIKLGLDAQGEFDRLRN